MADLSITAASVIPSALADIPEPLAAAVTIAAGQTVYKDTSVFPNVLRLADSDLSAAASVVAGIALNSAGAGQKVRYVTKDPALVLGCTMTVGDTIWQSDTAGGMTLNGKGTSGAELEAGDYVTVIGVCTVVNSTINMSLIPAGAVIA